VRYFIRVPPKSIDRWKDAEQCCKKHQMMVEMSKHDVQRCSVRPVCDLSAVILMFICFQCISFICLRIGSPPNKGVDSKDRRHCQEAPSPRHAPSMDALSHSPTSSRIFDGLSMFHEIRGCLRVPVSSKAFVRFRAENNFLASLRLFQYFGGGGGADQPKV
jgi:hypothetical protein